MAEREEEFAALGVCLAVIGNGEVHHLTPFREATGYRGTLVTDPSRHSFAVLGFYDSLSRTVSLKSAARAVAALKDGYRPGLVQGSASQLGGAVVIDPEATVRYYFRGSEAGEHPAVADLLAAAAG